MDGTEDFTLMEIECLRLFAEYEDQRSGDADMEFAGRLHDRSDEIKCNRAWSLK